MPLQKIGGGGHVQNFGNGLKAARANAIGAFFIFLHLLKGKAKREAQLFLRHAKYGAAHTNAAANMLINRIRRSAHAQYLQARNLNGAAFRSNLSNQKSNAFL